LNLELGGDLSHVSLVVRVDLGVRRDRLGVQAVSDLGVDVLGSGLGGGKGIGRGGSGRHFKLTVVVVVE